MRSGFPDADHEDRKIKCPVTHAFLALKLAVLTSDLSTCPQFLPGKHFKLFHDHFLPTCSKSLLLLVPYFEHAHRAVKLTVNK